MADDTLTETVPTMLVSSLIYVKREVCMFCGRVFTEDFDTWKEAPAPFDTHFREHTTKCKGPK
jgi:hypothetical protein